MPDAKQLLDSQFLEMRWRVLSLAADLDRLQRQSGFASITADPRLSNLRQAIAVLLDESDSRAERVQLIFSDKSPSPR